uniref:Beta-galactosidase n=1 Tax=Lygus hesperus TaxID=30085 RepID=A0A0A9Y9G5_LYGHE
MATERGAAVAKTFVQDLENNCFLLDGSPFTPMSGEMHYFRVPRPSWEDRLAKIKAANLNCVTTAVEWGLHEPCPGLYDFENEMDLKAFINLAASQQLLVILKIGPQAASDRDFGGLPSWLLSVNPEMKCRTQEESFTYFFGRWLRRLYGQIQDLLAGKGGPIIMIQIEDAYGSNPVQDRNYQFWLRDINRSLVGKNAILFTSDFPKKGCVERGHIPGVLATVKFGASNEPVINQFEELRKVQPSGPLMNSQFWVGCPTYWKDPQFNKLDVQVFKDDLVQMISMGIGFNLYMFHGGTNFGLTAGLKTEGKYCLTSYDFDAPISESGDITLKYLLIQKLLTGAVGGDVEETTEEEKNGEISPVLEDIEATQLSEKGDYGKILFTPVDTLLNCQMSCCRKSCVSLFPKSMEEMNLRDGLMAYTTVLRDGADKDAELRGTVRDRAYVILNNTDVIGIMENGDVLKLSKPVEEKSKLTFLVENQGRRPYKSGRTVTKGLFNMYLNGSLLDNWVITVFSMNGPKSIMKLQNNLRKKMRRAGQRKAEEHRFDDPPLTSGGSQKEPQKGVEAVVAPAFYVGTFTLPQEDEEDNANKDKTHELDLDSEISYEDLGDTFKDSFLDMTGWKKGIVYLNSFCLGRYWDAGPQRTLFVPGSLLLPFPWKNKITILELEAASKSLTAGFVLTPKLEVDDVIDVSVPQGLDGDTTAKPSEKESGGAEGGKAPGGEEVEKKQSVTEAEKMQSQAEAEKMQSGTEADQVLNGADAEKPAEIAEEKEPEN